MFGKFKFEIAWKFRLISTSLNFMIEMIEMLNGGFKIGNLPSLWKKKENGNYKVLKN